MAKLILILFVFPINLVAQEPYIEVREALPKGASTASRAQVFAQREISKSSSADLGDFLSKKGLSVQRQGGEGQTSALYLRGAEADQVLVLVDGVPMNDSSNPDRRFDFSKIPLSEIRRIEILKGAQSVRYGSQALGGAIRIWTRSTQEKKATQIEARAGSFKTTGLSGSLLMPMSSQLQAGISGQFLETSGYSAARGGAEDDAHRSQSGAASLGFNSENIRSQYSFRRLNQLTDIDRGGGALNDDPNFISRFSQDTHSLITTLPVSEDLSLELTLGYSEVERHADNQPDENSTANEYGNYWGEQRRLELTMEQRLFTSANLLLGFEHTGEEAHGDSNFFTLPKSTAEKNDGFVFYDHHFEKLNINTGLRFENHSKFGDNTSYEVGSGYQLTSSQNLSLRWSRATKWPSLSELFTPIYGNPELAPEKSTSLELNWQMQKNNWLMATTLFENRYKDLITSDPTTFRSINQGRARTRGAEVELEFELDRFKTEIRYQYLDPRNTDTGEELLRRSRHQAYLAETYRWGRFEVSSSLKFNSSRRDLDPVNSTQRIRLKEYYVWGIQTSYQWQKWELWASVENLADRQYEEVAGYLAQPQSFWVGLRGQL